MTNSSFSDKSTLDLLLIKQNLSNTYVIHYATMPLPQIHGGSKPGNVITINVRNAWTKQAQCFSISRFFERKKITRPVKRRKYLKKYELQIICAFYDFVKNNPNCYWVSWKTSSSVYGFEAIANRFLALGGSPKDIPIMQNNFDLHTLLVNIYGNRLDRQGMLETLAKRNDFEFKNFLTGEQSAELARNYQFEKVDPSVIEKTDIIRKLLILAGNQTLETKPLYLSKALAPIKKYRKSFASAFVILMALAYFLTGVDNLPDMATYKREKGYKSIISQIKYVLDFETSMKGTDDDEKTGH